jgi:hypothetical protein
MRATERIGGIRVNELPKKAEYSRMRWEWISETGIAQSIYRLGAKLSPPLRPVPGLKMRGVNPPSPLRFHGLMLN